MHMCWLGGHFDEEYTPWEYLRRGAKASLSVIRLPSRRKTASVPATSRNPRPRTRNEPCWTTAARSASRCSAAQVEEVIPPADLVLRDAEYLCPCGGQPVLCRRTRPVVALFGRIEFSGERH